MPITVMTKMRNKMSKLLTACGCVAWRGILCAGRWSLRKQFQSCLDECAAAKIIYGLLYAMLWTYATGASLQVSLGACVCACVCNGNGHKHWRDFMMITRHKLKTLCKKQQWQMQRRASSSSDYKAFPQRLLPRARRALYKFDSNVYAIGQISNESRPKCSLANPSVVQWRSLCYVG